MGLKGTVLKWFQSFLSDRSFLSNYKKDICVTFFTYISTSRIRITTPKVLICTYRGKKVQIWLFKGTAPATSCCTPKGTILNPYFSVCR